MSVHKDVLIITPELWSQMAADVATRFPEEACGFVAGNGNYSQMVIPVKNMLHDPHHFRMDPDEELKAFLHVEEKGLDILAIYHSHPYGISRPSPTDFSELTFPGIIYLIWYQMANTWNCRGYLMESPSNADEIRIIRSANNDIKKKT